MSNKITDLDRFVETDIYSPYKNNLDEAYKRLHTPIPRTLEKATYHLMNAPEWREMVLGRLRSIGYTFPDYIQHPLVAYLKDKL